MITVRKGISSEMMTGKPIAAGNVAVSEQFYCRQINKHTNCLCDSHGNTEAKNLDHNKKQDSPASDPLEWIIRWHGGPVLDKVADFYRDTIAVQSIEPHIPAGVVSIEITQSQRHQRTTIQQVPLWVSRKEHAKMDR